MNEFMGFSLGGLGLRKFDKITLMEYFARFYSCLILRALLPDNIDSNGPLLVCFTGQESCNYTFFYQFKNPGFELSQNFNVILWPELTKLLMIQRKIRNICVWIKEIILFHLNRAKNPIKITNNVWIRTNSLESIHLNWKRNLHTLEFPTINQYTHENTVQNPLSTSNTQKHLSIKSVTRASFRS